MATTSSSIDPHTLQQWANDPAAATAHVTELLECLRGEGSSIDWATEALENCGPPSTAHLAALQVSAGDAHPDVSSWACRLIGRMGADASPAEATLVSVLTQHASAETRRQSALALSKLDKLSAESLSALQQAAHSTDARLARAAQQTWEDGSQTR